MNKQTGITFLELLIVLALIATLLVIGVPNFNNVSKRNRMTTNANEIYSAMQYARTEALRRGGSVAVTSTDGADWSTGLVIFADADSDGVLDSGEEEIRVWGKFASGTELTTEGGSEAIAFDSRGVPEVIDTDGTTATVSGNNLEIFKLCDDRDGETGRKINLLISGSVWISDANDC